MHIPHWVESATAVTIFLTGLPPEERVEGTAAAVALAVAGGARIVRVHDVLAMVRVARSPMRSAARGEARGGVRGIMGFEWDPDKAINNALKHHVRFQEAASVYDDPLSITVFDEEHSDAEPRYITIGNSNGNRLLVVCSTHRGDSIRIISARSAGRIDRIRYEESTYD